MLKRAQRLRKLTGNQHLRSQSEIDQAEMSAKAIAYDSLVRPFVLAAEPALLFANVFIGLVCTSFHRRSHIHRLTVSSQTPSSICGLKHSHVSIHRAFA